MQTYTDEMCATTATETMTVDMMDNYNCAAGSTMDFYVTRIYASECKSSNQMAEAYAASGACVHAPSNTTSMYVVSHLVCN